MKTSQKLNPSKYDILNWINNLLPKTVKKVCSIEQLGSGVAYLHAVNCLRPGSVRLDRILNQPQNQYEINCNLKLLSSVFEKLHLQHTFQIEKVAQMKYQDNYHLASFLFKLYVSEQRQNEPHYQQTLVKTAQPAKKVKIVLPRNPISHPLKKPTPPPTTKETILELRPQPNTSTIQVQRVESSEPVADEEKLAKIATILNFQRKPQKVHSEKGKSQILQKVQQPRLNPISESFKRLLRPSICERSKYIKQFVDQNVPRHNFTTIRWEGQLKASESTCKVARQQRTEQLLSQKKEQYNPAEMNREESATQENRQENNIPGDSEKQEQSLMFGI